MKVSAKGQSPTKAKQRMDRALSEFRSEALKQIFVSVKLINHQALISLITIQNLLIVKKVYLSFRKKRQASKPLNFLAEAIVSSTEVANRPKLREATLQNYLILATKSKKRNKPLIRLLNKY